MRNLGVQDLEADEILKLFGTYFVILSLRADFATQQVLGPSHLNLLVDWKIIDCLIRRFEKPVLSELKNLLFCHLTRLYCTDLYIPMKKAPQGSKREASKKDAIKR